MKKKMIPGGIIAAFAVMTAIAGCAGTKEAESGVIYTVVETAGPETGTIELYTNLIGTVEPERMERIYPEAPGNVTEVFVKAGDWVSAGQPICTIDTKQVDSAENTMDNAGVIWQEAKTVLGRMELLYQTGAIAAQEYEGYVNTEKKAEIAYRQAKEDYEKQVSYSNIRSSISGRVEYCGMEVLDRVTSGDMLCVISGEGKSMIASSLTENLKLHVNPGDTVMAEKNGEAFTGTVSEISGMVDGNTGLYGIKIQMEDSIRLTTGTTVKLSICSNRAEQALTVPVDSVYYENSLPYVFTLEEGIVHKVFIDAGIYDSERREVTGGLKPDARIITTWSPELYEGARAVAAEGRES